MSKAKITPEIAAQMHECLAALIIALSEHPDVYKPNTKLFDAFHAGADLLGSMVPRHEPAVCANPECDEETCQECCEHDEHDHGICLGCEKDVTNDLIGTAESAFEVDR